MPRLRIEIPVLIGGENPAQFSEISVSSTPSPARPGDDLEPALSYGLTHRTLCGDHIWIGRSSERADRESTPLLANDRQAGSVRDRRSDINDKTPWLEDPSGA